MVLPQSRCLGVSLLPPAVSGGLCGRQGRDIPYRGEEECHECRLVVRNVDQLCRFTRAQTLASPVFRLARLDSLREKASHFEHLLRK